MVNYSRKATMRAIWLFLALFSIFNSNLYARCEYLDKSSTDKEVAVKKRFEFIRRRHRSKEKANTKELVREAFFKAEARCNISNFEHLHQSHLYTRYNRNQLLSSVLEAQNFFKDITLSSDQVENIAYDLYIKYLEGIGIYIRNNKAISSLAMEEKRERIIINKLELETLYLAGPAGECIGYQRLKGIPGLFICDGVNIANHLNREYQNLNNGEGVEHTSIYAKGLCRIEVSFDLKTEKITIDHYTLK